MAQLGWTLTGAAGSVSRSSPNIPEPQLTRLLDYIWDKYPQVDGNGDVVPRTQAEEIQAWKQWADEQYRQLKKDVIAFEKTKAARQAVEAVGDIEEA